MHVKIFITEDDSFYGKILTTKLEIDGYEVKVVDNGQKMLDLLNEDTPDLIILDLLTPVMDGFETLKRIKAEMPNLKETPKVVLTNLGQSEDVSRTKELGAIDHIVKTDLSIQELVFKIKKYIPNKSDKKDPNNENENNQNNPDEGNSDASINEKSEAESIQIIKSKMSSLGPPAEDKKQEPATETKSEEISSLNS